MMIRRQLIICQCPPGGGYLSLCFFLFLHIYQLTPSLFKKICMHPTIEILHSPIALRLARSTAPGEG